MSSKVTPESEDWRARLLSTPEQIDHVLAQVKRVAVIGIKPKDVGGPAHTVPAYMQQVGYDIVPVPVYYPEVTEILGAPVHRSLATIDPPADMVQLFRRSEDVPKHIDEILAAEPSVVWMQLGIRNDEAAERFARAGMWVVQDRCTYVELKRAKR
ncbi:MAG TPA: CoA-binding protein [Gemmatimonas sp.]|uniref:CoA-binding protein n=1 Tax=Gemmatimonas sp. TaxID=1962908 RepID=UPI002EDB92A0